MTRRRCKTIKGPSPVGGVALAQCVIKGDNSRLTVECNGGRK